LIAKEVKSALLQKPWLEQQLLDEVCAYLGTLLASSFPSNMHFPMSITWYGAVAMQHYVTKYGVFHQEMIAGPCVDNAVVTATERPIP
jgi:hypothetical protein